MLQDGISKNVLVKRVVFTLFILLVFRLGVHVPVPGVDGKELASFAAQQDFGLLKMFNMFSGGALSNFSIFSLAVMPYISASIIMQLLSVVLPSLEQLQKEGGVGRQKITRITRLLAYAIALVQGYLLATGLQAARGQSGAMIVLEPGLSFKILATFLMATGSVFVMWMGEQITEKGIGSGISLIIFAGIVAYLPPALAGLLFALKQNSITFFSLLLLLIFTLSLVALVAFFEQSYRKIPIHHAKRTVGKRVMSTQATHLPVRVNMSGIMAAIFASTLLALPATFLGFGKFSQNVWLAEFIQGHWLYNVVFVIVGFGFSFLYTSIIFKPDEIAENLKKQNAYIPGVRPGSETATALESVVTRLTLAGAFYMTIIVILPSVLLSGYSQRINLGGTSLLIVVGVGLELMRQVNMHLTTQKYDNLFFQERKPRASFSSPNQ
jgi:preprotein translocase subunit SecY